MDKLLDQPWHPQAPAMPQPSGPTLHVASTEALFEAADTVDPGTTILIADGHYFLPGVFTITTDRVTIRSASGQRHSVILDGADSAHGELFGFTECHQVTVADLTIQNIMDNGFKLNGNIGRSVKGITIHNCVIHNIWQRGIKSVSGPEADDDSGLPLRPADTGQAPRPRHFVEGCAVRYCLFYNDRPKRFEDDSFELENPDRFCGNYIAGLDVMSARGWTIADNVLVNIKGNSGGGRGAIFVWQGSEDVRIERNIIVDCDSGMWLGLAYPPEDTRHCVRFIVRDNLITRARCAGILLSRHVEGRVLHNTICDPVDLRDRPAGIDIDDGGVLTQVREQRSRPMRLGMGNQDLLVADNLMTGPSDLHVSEAAGSLRLRDNIWLPEPEPSPFIDPACGDPRLTPAAARTLTAGATLQRSCEASPACSSPLSADETNP